MIVRGRCSVIVAGVIVCLASVSFATRPATDSIVDAPHNVKHLYIIGDSHGDLNYLVRCLLATPLFQWNETRKTLLWNPQSKFIGPDSSFEVVVLGDFIDRGSFSKKCILLLKELSEDRDWGSHLTVLMGNHESMMLRGKGLKYAEGDTWSARERYEDLHATEGENFELVEWMCARPVVHLAQNVLMMHGGLSQLVANQVIQDPAGHLNETKCAIYGPTCGAAAVNFINSMASAFYNDVHHCIQKSSEDEYHKCNNDMGGLPFVIATEREKWSKVSWTCEHSKCSGGGVLWFRGFSSKDAGAGSPEACKESSKVAQMFGAKLMAVAHTTHPQIVEYCHDTVPVFACDTHYTDCKKTNECDFNKAHAFHAGKIDSLKASVPQVLYIRSHRDHSTLRKCLSLVTANTGEVKVECFKIENKSGSISSYAVSLLLFYLLCLVHIY